MIDHQDDFHSPFKLDLLLRDTVSEVLEHEDPQRYFDWLGEHLHEYLSTTSPELLAHPEDVSQIVASLGRAIWNAMPLPGNNFKPRPLPEPGRNHPCPCGSGRKYKLCCARGPAAPAIDSRLLWPLVLVQLPRDSLQEAISRGWIPILELYDLADQCWERNQPKKGVFFLEPLFSGPVRKPDEAHDYALNLLCNFYDELGHHKKKAAVLKQVIDTTRRSPLRSGAWQRTAAILIDDGNVSGAWEAFREAQRDDPNSFGLAVLEVQLLIAENRLTEAKMRADFWVKRLRRAGLSDDDGPLEFLSAIARDPLTAMMDISMEMAGGEEEKVGEWLRTVEGRLVPEYHLTTDSPAPGEDWSESLEERLRDMGVPHQEIERTLAKLQQDLEAGPVEAQSDAEEIWDDSQDSLLLAPPSNIGKLEADWHEVFPLGKPFSINDQPFEVTDLWDAEIEWGWVEFLFEHPEAFDSLDIIDDLATALMQHDQHDTLWLDETLLKPLLLRAASIMEHAVNDSASPRIAWINTENRPALRSLARLTSFYLRASDDANALKWSRRLLALNPHDNHGFRSIVVNQLLHDGDDAAVLEIAKNYPQDMQPDVPYGQVLALYRLKRLEEAQDALSTAAESLPKVVHYLTAKRVRMPKLDPMGVQMGGDDQAWLYRDDMREVWLETPGAIDWLKQAAKAV